jgi:alpha-1,3-rhamnosyl/mannosyltransferase
MMRVVINQATTLGQKAGIGHYTDQLVRHLRDIAGSSARIDTFPRGWIQAGADGYSRIRAHFYTGRDHASAGDGLFMRGQRAALTHLYRAGQRLMGWHFRRLCARHAYDLYHEPNGLPLPNDRRTVATFHDLSLLLNAEWHTAERAAHFERQLPRALTQCAHFLTDSDFIKAQMIELLGVRPERITRVHLGIRAGLAPLSEQEVIEGLTRLRLPRRYLLYVGTIEPRKNLLPLLQAFCDLPAPLRERWPLLLVGRWGWNARDVADYLQQVGRERGVLHLGYVNEEDLGILYNGARALIYPSLYEGFGLPPLEMMACGGAVLASTAGAVVETVGERAHLVAPEDVGGWRDSLHRVLTEDDWWRSLREGTTKLAERFTWQRCAEETFDVYRRVCGLAPSCEELATCA